MDVIFADCGIGLQIHCVSALGSLNALMSRCFVTMCLIASCALQNLQKAWACTSHHESKSTYLDPIASVAPSC